MVTLQKSEEKGVRIPSLETNLYHVHGELQKKNDDLYGLLTRYSGVATSQIRMLEWLKPVANRRPLGQEGKRANSAATIYCPVNLNMVQKNTNK
jgi:hypothetical protein